MAKKRRAKVDRFAKLKIAAIPLLLAVLGFVLWSNFGDRPGRSSTKRVANKAATASETSTNRKVESSPAVVAKTKVEAWPEPSLEFLKLESPFRKMDYEPPKQQSEQLVSKPKISERTRAKDALESAAKMLRSAKIEYTFQSQNQSAFMFRDRLIKVGDELTKDIIVRSITEQGIELALKDLDVAASTPAVN